ncbi:MAG: hypothetical protein COA47_01975 [Robiginitomaculum sp.]|nr:MAG: hypothetical protein COA47_01975 [Robiginitomaculum sp.]
MEQITRLSKVAIQLLQEDIAAIGLVPIVQFELEGTCLPSSSSTAAQEHFLDFPAINHALKQKNIQGKFKPEYWEFQWEWAAAMEGQSPAKAAQDLEDVMTLAPSLLQEYGAKEVWIQPVFWSGNTPNRPLLKKDQSDVSPEKPVHIPNAIQLNISALNAQGDNALLHNGLGEILQNRLLITSHECCLFFAPEDAAFTRFRLKDEHNLHEELSSPHDLSGGHQGSIAFYQKTDKHAQPIGKHWRQICRVEHRLGAASRLYNPHLNCAFALANLSDAIHISRLGQSTGPKLEPFEKKLSAALHIESDQNPGAFCLFENSKWFANKLDALSKDRNPDIGTQLKNAICQFFQPSH